MDPITLQKKEFEIRAGEVDRRGVVTIPALMQLMQETSLKHVIKLKASIWDMKDASWVLLSKEINIIKLPNLGDKITIRTYPAGVKRIYAYRDFWIYDEDGKVIVTASTTWTLLNLGTRKLQPIPETVKDLPIPDGFEPLQNPPMKLKLKEELKMLDHQKIGYYHLDWNNHVNNVHYLKFMLESIADHLPKYEVQTINIVFKGEALYKDRVEVHGQFDQSSNESHHKISSSAGKEITSALINWKKV